MRILAETPLNDCKVNCEIFVPEKTEISAKAINGWLAFYQLKGRIVGEATNGWVTLEDISGSVNLKTVNGWIKFGEKVAGEVNVRATNGWIKGLISSEVSEAIISTVNGNIDLSVPEDIKPVVYATTENGKIKSDFPVWTTRESFKQAKGRPKIRVETTNGNIRIRKTK